MLFRIITIVSGVCLSGLREVRELEPTADDGNISLHACPNYGIYDNHRNFSVGRLKSYDVCQVNHGDNRDVK